MSSTSCTAYSEFFLCTGYTKADNLGRIVSIAFDRVNWSAALDEGDGVDESDGGAALDGKDG